MLLKSTEGEGKYDGLAAQKLEEGIHFNHPATTTHWGREVEGHELQPEGTGAQTVLNPSERSNLRGFTQVASGLWNHLHWVQIPLCQL